MANKGKPKQQAGNSSMLASARGHGQASSMQAAAQGCTDPQSMAGAMRKKGAK